MKFYKYLVVLPATDSKNETKRNVKDSENGMLHLLTGYLRSYKFTS